MRGRSRRKKRTGKMVSLQKRFLAFMLAFAMIFTNVGTDLHVSFAASGNRVDFTIGGADLVDAIRQECVPRGVRFLRLDTGTNEPVVRDIYLKAGFQIVKTLYNHGTPSMLLYELEL